MYPEVRFRFESISVTFFPLGGAKRDFDSSRFFWWVDLSQGKRLYLSLGSFSRNKFPLLHP